MNMQLYVYISWHMCIYIFTSAYTDLICLHSLKCCPSGRARFCVASGMRTSVFTGDLHLCFCCFSSPAFDVSLKKRDAELVQQTRPSTSSPHIRYKSLCVHIHDYVYKSTHEHEVWMRHLTDSLLLQNTPRRPVHSN